MSRSNSAIIYLIVAALVLIAGIWGLNQAGILSIGGKQPTTAPAAAVQEPVQQTDTASNSATGGQAATEAVTSTTETGAATGTNSDSNAAAQPASGGQVAADASTAARIIARGKLVVGVRDNLAEFAQTDANGERSGMDIELAHEFAKRWLGDPSLIEFVTINAANQIPTLVNGDVDLLIAAIAATRDRAQLVDFSQAYHISHNMLIVRNETIINGLRGLQDKQVAVVEDGSDIEVITGLIASESLSITVASQSIVCHGCRGTEKWCCRGHPAESPSV
jgi:ABC-type amino acid transport substrate-binding protein